MKKIDKVTFQEIIYPIIMLSVISLVVSAALAITNTFTAPVIEANEKTATLGAYVEVIPSIADASELSSVDFTATGIEGVVSAPDGSFGVKAVQPGYDGGDIILIVGFGPDGTTSGVWVDAITQTSGIGTKVGEAVFSEQFLGLDGTVPAKAGESVDLIAGATVSSTAFLTAYNNCVDAYLAVKEG